MKGEKECTLFQLSSLFLRNPQTHDMRGIMQPNRNQLYTHLYFCKSYMYWLIHGKNVSMLMQISFHFLIQSVFLIKKPHPSSCKIWIHSLFITEEKSCSHVLVNVEDPMADKFIKTGYLHPDTKQPTCTDKRMCYIITCLPFPYHPRLTDQCRSARPYLRNLGGHVCCIMQFVFMTHRQRKAPRNKDRN